jgi:hypothetical protein
MKRRQLFFNVTLTFKPRNAMTLIARRYFFFAALRPAKKKQQRTLDFTLLRTLGLTVTQALKV